MTYIYLLCEPDGETPRYIGKANNPWKRAEGHVKEALGGKNTHKCCWIRKLFKQGQSFVTMVLEKVTEDKWQERESHWIAHYRSLGYEICNATDGGEGLKNPSEETRKKIAEEARRITKERWKDPEHRKKVLESVRRAFADPEYRKKRSENSKRMWEDVEFRRKQSEAATKMWEDPKHRELRQSVEYKKKQSLSQKKRFEDLEQRKHRSENQKKLWEDPEYRKKMVEVHKKRCKDPKERKRLSDIRKKRKKNVKQTSNVVELE